jgi:hypothetical protein
MIWVVYLTKTWILHAGALRYKAKSLHIPMIAVFVFAFMVLSLFYV